MYHRRPPRPTQIVAEMASYGNGIEKLCEPQQPRPQDHFERRELNGIFPQPQEGLFRVGVHIPVGRLSAQEARDLAMVADKYVPGGEVRPTVLTLALPQP